MRATEREECAKQSNEVQTELKRVNIVNIEDAQQNTCKRLSNGIAPIRTWV